MSFRLTMTVPICSICSARPRQHPLRTGLPPAGRQPGEPAHRLQVSVARRAGLYSGIVSGQGHCRPASDSHLLGVAPTMAAHHNLVTPRLCWRLLLCLLLPRHLRLPARAVLLHSLQPHSS